MKAKVNGIEINYSVEGEGPWITLSHSLACDYGMWDPQMDMLKKHFKVLRFDTRGHGQSSAPDAEYTLEQMADDVHGLFAHLGITKSHWTRRQTAKVPVDPSMANLQGCKMVLPTVSTNFGG